MGFNSGFKGLKEYATKGNSGSLAVAVKLTHGTAIHQVAELSEQ